MINFFDDINHFRPTIIGVLSLVFVLVSFFTHLALMKYENKEDSDEFMTELEEMKK